MGQSQLQGYLPHQGRHAADARAGGGEGALQDSSGASGGGWMGEGMGDGCPVPPLALGMDRQDRVYSQRSKERFFPTSGSSEQEWGTSLIRTPPPVGPYSSPMHRDLW